MREEDTVCVGSDGLQYCKVCGEAKEAFFPEGGFMGMKKHSRQCACDRKAYEEEQKYFKEYGSDSIEVISLGEKEYNNYLKKLNMPKKKKSFPVRYSSPETENR